MNSYGKHPEFAGEKLGLTEEDIALGIVSKYRYQEWKLFYEDENEDSPIDIYVEMSREKIDKIKNYIETVDARRLDRFSKQFLDLDDKTTCVTYKKLGEYCVAIGTKSIPAKFVEIISKVCFEKEKQAIKIMDAQCDYIIPNGISN